MESTVTKRAPVPEASANPGAAPTAPVLAPVAVRAPVIPPAAKPPSSLEYWYFCDGGATMRHA